MFRIKGSSNMAAAVLLVLVLCVAVTLLSNRHYRKWDLTATGEHTLSDKTLQVLGTIREAVEMKAFVQDESRELKRLLASYRDHSPKVTFEMIDPDRQPSMANRYQVKTLNTVVLDGYGSTQSVKIPDEESITNALIRLSRQKTHKAYFLKGHGERSLKGAEPESFSSLQSALSKENVELEELNLMNAEVPADASLVIIAAPAKPFFPEEIESLSLYLSGGGGLMIFLEPFADGGLEPLLRENGILVSGDIVVDKMSRIMGGDYLVPMVANYGRHEITRDFRLPSFFPTARSIEASPEKTTDHHVTSLAFTSANSWAETDRETLEQGKAGFDGQDREGPISLAAISERRPQPGIAGNEKENPGRGRLVVFGDADFASNKFMSLSGNSDFVYNTVNYLAGREDLITIQREKRQSQALMLSREQGQLLFWVPVVFIPALVLILGVFVWNKRRSR